MEVGGNSTSDREESNGRRCRYSWLSPGRGRMALIFCPSNNNWWPISNTKMIKAQRIAIGERSIGTPLISPCSMNCRTMTKIQLTRAKKESKATRNTHRKSLPSSDCCWTAIIKFAKKSSLGSNSLSWTSLLIFSSFIIDVLIHPPFPFANESTYSCGLDASLP